LQYLLFEQPYALIPLVVVAAYACLVIWLRRRTPGAKRALIVALLLAVLLPILQWWVVTDRERIHRICLAMTASAEQGDVAAFDRYVSSRFEVGELDRAALRAAAERAYTRYDIVTAKLKSPQIEVNQDRAEVDFGVQVTMSGGDFPGQGLTTWTAVFEREADGWRLVEIHPRRTPFFPFDRLEELVR
jgi:hypothetical protein